MKLLILGGTRFLGRHLAQQALERGHALTLLHRGHSGAGLFPQARHVIADRNGDLAALQDPALGSWDAAIDTNAFVPRHVRSMAAALAGRVGQYQMVSTISVYDGFSAQGTDETAPTAVLPDPTVETVGGASYGGLKALCEAAALDGFGGRCLVPRPGLLVGPHDPTGRFTWWLTRLLRGGEVLAPGDPGAAVQCIDARDAAAWLLLQAERGSTGVFNLTGPTAPTTIGALLDIARLTLSPAARLTWADEAFLLAHGVAPWMGMPLWLPRADPGLHAVTIDRAIAAGLRCRPLAETVADTAAWVAAEQPAAPPAVGLPPQREAALLAAWHAR